MRAYELQNTQPGISGLLLEFGEFAVEEAVGRTGIDDDFVLDSGLPKGVLECLNIFYRDALIVTPKKPEYRTFELGDAINWRGATSAIHHWRPVEPYDASEAVMTGCLQE